MLLTLPLTDQQQQMVAGPSQDEIIEVLEMELQRLRKVAKKQK